MNQLPLRARLYIAGIACLAAGLLVYLLPQPPRDVRMVLVLVIFGVAAVLADLHPVILPRSASLSVSTAIYVANTVVLGPAWGTWFATLTTGFSEIARRKPWYKVVFNTSTAAIWTAFAGLTYASTFRGGDPLDPFGIAAVVGYAVTGVLGNTLIVSAIIALVQRLPVLQVWRMNHRGVLLQILTMIPLGLLLAATYLQASILGLLLLVLPLVVLYYSLRATQLLRMETQRTIEILADCLDKRDNYTACHSTGVAEYAEQIARALNLGLEEVEAIISAARVHDLGKIKTPDAILLKPGKLAPEEWRVMQEHAEVGAEIVSKLSLYRRSLDIVLYHHERYDGLGYPSGLKGEEIPLGARIIAVADAYQAMTSDRPYRQALPREVAIERLRTGANVQWDPAIVELFITLLVGEPGKTLPIPIQRPLQG